MSYHVVLSPIGAVAEWRRAARQLLASDIPPEGVKFGADTGLFPSDPLPQPDRRLPTMKLAKPALQIIETALCHSDPQRFDRAYGVLWRIRQGELRFGDRSDPVMRKIMLQEKEVRRDIHKMHAFVRFREGPTQEGRRAFAAWFEPTHHIVEAGTPFFAKRFGDMDWMIKTPRLTAVFRDRRLTYEETKDPTPPPDDATEALWCDYYAAIFNPARLMVSAMQSEMPQKYWKNLPEAQQIPHLIRTAPERVQAMNALAPSPPPAFARAVQRQTRAGGCEGIQDDTDPAMAEAKSCTRCAIGACATQLVWGEGPRNAPVMIVGEQPGDQEDLTGRPFVGPAGAVLDQALGVAGVDRAQLYVTNAVKHFKFQPRGKRRLHQRPDAGEVQACQWWLDLEIERVRSRLIVALGATAAHALTGRAGYIMRRRGQIELGRAGIPVYLTVHPSFLLRLHDRAEAERQTRAFQSDLMSAFDHVGLRKGKGMELQGVPPAP